MAEKANIITLTDLEKAVKTAVQELQKQPARVAAFQSVRPTIMGKWIRDANVPEAEAQAAAAEITRRVSAEIPGLKLTPFSVSGPGGTTMGYVMSEE
jgi:hypothetical protein